MAAECARQCSALLHAPKRRFSWRSLGINLMLSAVSLSVFFGSAELLARTQYTPQKFESNGMFTYDKDKVFRLRENQSNFYHGAAFTTNSFGHRDAEIPVEKPEGTRRVLVIGDSISFGHGVSDADVYPYLLETMLRGDPQHAGSPIDVINAAAPGNSPFQEYYDVKRGLRFDPDLIIVQFTLNDVLEQYASWIFKEMGWNTAGDGRDESKLARYVLGGAHFSHMDHVLKQHSALYLCLKDMQGRLRFGEVSGEHLTAQAQQEENSLARKLVEEPANPEVVQAWENALGWMERIIDTANNHEIPLVVLATPFEFQIKEPPEKAYPQRILQGFTHEQGVEYVDLLAVLHEQFAHSVQNGGIAYGASGAPDAQSSEALDALWRNLFLDYDHPSPAGHALIANILQPVVARALAENAQ